MTRKPGIALITGGSSRIGEAMARDLADHGFAVVLHANESEQKVEDLAEKISHEGGRASFFTADLTAPRALSGVIAKASEPFGTPNLLINNASIFEPDSVGELDQTTFDRHFAIHVRAPSFLAQDFAAALGASEQRGLIINIIDQRVWKLTPRYYSYTLSKSALWTATQTMAQELAPLIRVNAIGPGPSFRNKRQTSENFAAQNEAILLGHGPAADEFGRTVRYLWETPSITGQMIALDGGQHLAWETADVLQGGE